MADEIGVGLIGYGMGGSIFHAPIIASVPHLRLKKVVERHGDDSRKRYPWVEVVRDVDAVLSDEEIGLVVVATPNVSHFDLARRALLAGKHVVVEKPFTTTSGQAQQLIELAEQQQRLISVHQNRRWDGDFLTVKRLLEGRLLGRLVDYEAQYNRFRNYLRQGDWKEEGEGSGILFNLGSHLIDQAQVLFGLPRLITADIRVQRDLGKADDNYELILHYDDLKVTLKSGMLVREQSPRFILHGTEGSFVKYGLDPQEEALKRGLTPSEPNWGEEPREQWGTINTDGVRFSTKAFEHILVVYRLGQKKFDGDGAVSFEVYAGIDGLHAAVRQHPVEAVLLRYQARARARRAERGLIFNAAGAIIFVALLTGRAELHGKTCGENG